MNGCATNLWVKRKFDNKRGIMHPIGKKAEKGGRYEQAGRTHEQTRGTDKKDNSTL